MSVSGTVFLLCDSKLDILLNICLGRKAKLFEVSNPQKKCDFGHMTLLSSEANMPKSPAGSLDTAHSDTWTGLGFCYFIQFFPGLFKQESFYVMYS